MTAGKRFNDFTVISNAMRYGLRLVAGDTKLLTAALRNGLTQPGQVIARLFKYEASERIAWYAKIRNSVGQFAPGLNPNAVTGSPVGR